MKKSIGKPCEGRLHARFDEGDSGIFKLLLYLQKCIVGRIVRLYSTVQAKNRNRE